MARPVNVVVGIREMDLVEQVEHRGFWPSKTIHVIPGRRRRAPFALYPGSQESVPYKDPKKHRDYYKNYMRRRRAGLATARPKARLPRRPPSRLVETVRHWEYLAQRAPWRLRQPAPNIIDGLDLASDEGMLEACRRYQAHLAAPCSTQA